MDKLYITDLDGTLLDDNAVLTKKSAELLSSVIENGGSFTVATARTFATVCEILKDVKLSLPMVLMNGVMIYDPVTETIISSEAIDHSAFNDVLSAYRKHAMSPLVYTDCGDHLLIKYNDEINDYQMRYVDVRNTVKGKKFLYSPTLSCTDEEKIIYLVMLNKYEALCPLYKDISKIKGISAVFYKDNYSDGYFLEIFAANVSKSSGLRKIKELVKAEKVIAFGDNLNDLELLKEADTGICVDNANDTLKKAADIVIGTNTDNAVAEYIYNDFWRNKND